MSQKRSKNSTFILKQIEKILQDVMGDRYNVRLCYTSNVKNDIGSKYCADIHEEKELQYKVQDIDDDLTKLTIKFKKSERNFTCHLKYSGRAGQVDVYELYEYHQKIPYVEYWFRKKV